MKITADTTREQITSQLDRLSIPHEIADGRIRCSVSETEELRLGYDLADGWAWSTVEDGEHTSSGRLDTVDELAELCGYRIDADGYGDAYYARDGVDPVPAIEDWSDRALASMGHRSTSV